MAGLCEGGNEPSGSLKAIWHLQILSDIPAIGDWSFPEHRQAVMLAGSSHTAVQYELQLAAVSYQPASKIYQPPARYMTHISLLATPHQPSVNRLLKTVASCSSMWFFFSAI
ncbi:hypothetical protein ANN_09887 [Periplaneta americana]|uniref:Uncharacterized protein n=1 Tax=Periplaneta americana TaxID=6978 RepID=A0ABQ8TNJ2_PERAM|nr:hypothetical protein ANN_09887 [Periplaneta americana]